MTREPLQQSGQIGRRFPVIALPLAVVLTCLVVLLPGWLGGNDLLTRLHPDFPRITPGAAISLMMVALAQVLALRSEAQLSDRAARLLRQAGTILAALPGCYAALRLGFWLGVGTPVFLGEVDLHDTTPPDTMALSTTLCLLLVAGCAALRCMPGGWSDRVLRRRSRAAATLGLLICLIGLSNVLLGGNGFGTGVLFATMGPANGLCLVALLTAHMHFKPLEGWTALILARSSDSRRARRLVAAAIALPVMLGLYLRSHPVVSPNGSEFLLGLMTVLLAALGVTVALLIASARNRSAQRAGAQERGIRDMLDALDAAVFAFDPSGRLLRVNAAARNLTAHVDTPQAWLDQAAFYHLELRDDPLPAEDRPFARLIRGDNAGEMTLGYLDPLQDERILHFTSRRAGSPAQWVLSVVDETDRWKLQSQTDRTERLDAITQMSGGIAHEMANILGVVRLSADTGLIAAQDTPLVRYFDAIQTACDRGAELTQRILELSGKPGGGGQAFDVARVVREAAAFVRRTTHSSISMQVTTPDAPLTADCDPRELENVVISLLVNAQNALADTKRREGHILLSVVARDNEIVVTVDDDGPGMTPEVLARAEEPFFTTRQKQGGTGLGLTMVTNFARRNHGHFKLTSSPGQGTTARISFAASSTETIEDPADPLPEAEVAQAPKAGALAGLKLLLIEDDPLFGEILAESLRHLGADLAHVTDGRAAASRLMDGTHLDALITDIVLPGGVNGFDLARMGRRSQPDLPVIYISGYAGSHPDDADHPPGIHLRKPMKVDELTRSILRLCRRPG
ncbi:hybrid sensor histidine kinase/response regulator [Pseudooceanicola algae]|uniref:histidine kinase n=1 Tax=Pseudooceanicola algae TaxID=1537215 RepID=A0A418SIS1_9RHOB|nr:PAS domain-containing sensor histidine kinase [Pseudooceanicola algae]QPM91201.1 Sensor histidine kinase RcsC [Pseudooceanicola algae]